MPMSSGENDRFSCCALKLECSFRSFVISSSEKIAVSNRFYEKNGNALFKKSRNNFTA